MIGSTNGRMPLEKSKNQISNIQTVSGNFKKKIAANWERVSSLKTEFLTDPQPKVRFFIKFHHILDMKKFYPTCELLQKLFWIENWSPRISKTSPKQKLFFSLFQIHPTLIKIQKFIIR